MTSMRSRWSRALPLAVTALVAVTVIPAPAAGDWSPNRRVTHTERSSLSPDVAVSGGVLHLVWMEFDSTAFRGQIRYTRSTDQGATWSTPRRMTRVALYARRPRISASGGVLHLVWTDDRTGESQVFYRRSTDGGGSWSAPRRLSFTPDGGGGWCETHNPDLAVAGSGVHVAWNDMCGPDVYSRRSLDGGLTWKKTRQVSPMSGQIPDIAASGDWVAAAWEANITDVHYSTSPDSGKSWSTPRSLSTSISHDPGLAVRGSRIDLAWSNQGPGNPEIFWKTSIDGGQTWTWRRITHGSRGDWCPVVLRAGPSNAQTLNFAWKRYNGGAVTGDSDVYHRARVTIMDGKVWVTKRISMPGESSVGCPSMTADNTNLYIVFSDDAPGNSEIYLRRFSIDAS